MTDFPQGFSDSLASLLHDELEAFLSALNGAPALAMRVNSFRAAAMDAAREFLDSPVPWARDGWYLKQGCRPGTAVAHAAGAYYLQEASAMAPAAALDVQKGERVLDLCAAPGGKSGQLAAALDGAGLLVCNEPEPSRAKMLAGNLERMGVRSAVVTNAYPDAVAAAWPGFFDAVLVDAPCSGEGMFRREPDARGQWNPAAPEGCARRQRDILRQAAALVRPGGRLVYSTCTFNPIENEGSVRTFLEENPDFSPVDFSLPGIGASTDGMIRLMPHRLRGDGQFAARFIRRGDDRPEGMHTPAKPPAGAADALRELVTGSILPEGFDLRLIGQNVYAVPAELPAAKGLRIVSPGLCLLRAEKNRFEPEHALAMALEPAQARQAAELNEEQAWLYLAGEAVPMDLPRGWTLAVYRGLPLGWGKAVDGTLKNHLPKGLRIRR